MSEEQIAEAVYQKLKANAFSELRAEMRDGFKEVSRRFDSMDARLEVLEDKVQANSDQIERISNGLDDRGWI